jgi:hypothetical protein
MDARDSRTAPGERAALTLLAVAAALGGCSGAGPVDPCAGENRLGYAGCVEGVSLVVPPEPGSSDGADALLGQTERAIAVAAEVWSVPRDTWSGWIVVVRAGWFTCPTSAGAEWSWGCAHFDRRLIEAAPGPDGCALGVLIHELGHAAGHPRHFGADGTYLFTEADRRSSEICDGGDRGEGEPDDEEDGDEDGGPHRDGPHDDDD